jgi:hypothetical protein
VRPLHLHLLLPLLELFLHSQLMINWLKRFKQLTWMLFVELEQIPWFQEISSMEWHLAM